MRKSTAERALIRASLDELRAEMAEQRALLLTLLVKFDAASTQPDDGTDGTLSVVEASALLGVSPYTVRAMCNDGRLVASKESNAAGWRITPDSVADRRRADA